MSREPLFARVSLANKLFLTEKAVSLNRSKNDILEEILNAFRLKRDFDLPKRPTTNKDEGQSALALNKKKVRELKEKRKERRGRK